MATPGDGSYYYLRAEGVGFAKNMGIGTLDCGTFHMHPGQWGYNCTWGNSWIKKHDAVGAKVGKPVVREEYDVQGTNTAAVEQQWQTTVVQSPEIVYDSLWQFGPTIPSEASRTGLRDRLRLR
jgi:mannan endo-1,4-beta-mannosidase